MWHNKWLKQVAGAVWHWASETTRSRPPLLSPSVRHMSEGIRPACSLMYSVVDDDA